MHLILTEKTSKRDKNVWMGRTDNFKKGYFTKNGELPVMENGTIKEYRASLPGDFVVAEVVETKSRILRCEPLAIASTINDYYNHTILVEKLK